jgi:hypothetical protein
VILSTTTERQEGVVYLEVGVDERDEVAFDEGDLVSVVEVKGPGVDRSYLVNLTRRRSNSWLQRTMVWALHNDASLKVTKATREDLQTRRMFVPRRDDDVRVGS